MVEKVIESINLGLNYDGLFTRSLKILNEFYNAIKPPPPLSRKLRNRAKDFKNLPCRRCSNRSTRWVYLD